jgi:hypothetical protein
MSEPDAIGLRLLREMRAEMTSGFADARSAGLNGQHLRWRH